MSDRYTAWYLLDGGNPDDAVLRVLQRLGVMEQVDAPWPRTAVTMNHGRLQLVCENIQQLQVKLGNRKGVVDAFYLGDLSVLDQLHDEFLVYGGERYVFRCNKSKNALERHPYCHRFVRIQFVDAAVVGGIEFVARANNVPQEGRLLFAPVAAQVSPSQSDAWTFDTSKLNAVVLPPYRDVEPSGYFRRDLREMRAALAGEFEAIEAAKKQALWAAWLTADAPEIRPFLTDGGHLDVVADSDLRTRLALKICRVEGAEGASESVAQYRAAFFEQSSSSTNAWWASATRDWLRRDLTTLLIRMLGKEIGRLDCSVVDEVHDWCDHQLPEYRPVDGIRVWDRINEIIDQLARSMGSGLARDAKQRILRPARPGVRGGADDDLAIMAFMRDLFRCVWDPGVTSTRGQSDDRAAHWRDAVLDAVLGLAELRPWEHSDDYRVKRTNVGELNEIAYPRRKRSDLLHWRLLAPIGTRFIDSARSELGEADTMVLGSTFRLL